jgi:hypothetical protein
MLEGEPVVFDLLARYTWFVFGLCAVVMAFGPITLRHHIRESRSAVYVHWLTMSMVFGAVSFMLMGVQTGDNPIIAKPLFIPWIRLGWLLSALSAIVFFVMYWRRRVVLRQLE